MKKSPLTLITGLTLLLIFVLLLFTFQVRQTEVAIRTTFGKFSNTIDKPGLYFKLPWPIQRIHKFENRVQSFQCKLEQTTTSEGRNLILTVFLGWKVSDARKFLERFDNGDRVKAESAIEGLVRDAKNSVFGRHPMSDLISPDPEKVRFQEIEEEMLAAIRSVANEEYGVEIPVLGIKQIGVPESITTQVLERMRAERMQLVKHYEGEGERKAIEIRAEADRLRQEILAEAEAKATEIRGQADAIASKSYEVFEENPDLAVFILQMKAMEEALKERTTLIIDQQTPPFNMLNLDSVKLPSGPAAKP